MSEQSNVWWILLRNDRRADIEGSKSNVATNAWLPQASYPCGNFSDTSWWKGALHSERIDGPCFRSPYLYWKSRSSELLPYTRFLSLLSSPWDTVLPFDRCTTPVKLPTWHVPRLRVKHSSSIRGSPQVLCTSKRAAKKPVPFFTGWARKWQKWWYFRVNKAEQHQSSDDRKNDRSWKRASHPEERGETMKKQLGVISEELKLLLLPLPLPQKRHQQQHKSPLKLSGCPPHNRDKKPDPRHNLLLNIMQLMPTKACLPPVLHLPCLLTDQSQA